MVLALVSSANDGDSKVRSTMQKSLFEIGKRQPNLVVSTCYDFIAKNKVSPFNERFKDCCRSVMIAARFLSDFSRWVINIPYSKCPSLTV